MNKIALATLLATISFSALAEDTTAAAKVSTLGLGLDVAFPVTEAVDARVGFNTFSYSFNTTSANAGGSTTYSGKLDLGSFEALADWHPWATNFRLSGGLVYNNNKFNMTAQPTGGNVVVGGVTYTAAQAGTVNASVDFQKIAPYLGIGWGSAAKDTGVSFAADLGVMFQGSPRAHVTATGAAVNAAALAQANADLNSKLNNFNIYPVASIGIGYTF